jgi:hypothetical protein
MTAFIAVETAGPAAEHLTAVVSDGPNHLFNFVSCNEMTNFKKTQIKHKISMTGGFRNGGALLLYF